jgi:riboflavin biosynthesis pyrimidine reductase
MRQIFPTFVDPVDPMTVYADLPVADGRPGVRCNMIASVDGATAVDGVAGGLANKADQDLFHLLRSLADVVLVAAGTVRAEGYGPSRVPIAVVTRSCNLDWESRFFTAQDARPVVVTVATAPAEARDRAAEVADVVVAGERDVDLGRAVDALGERGWRKVLCEGGPILNGQLAAAGLLDELCLTLSPRMVGGNAKRVLAGGPLLPGPPTYTLASACEQEGFLFLRYRAG